MALRFKEAVFSFKTKILSPRIEDIHRETVNSIINGGVSKLNFERRQELFQHAIQFSPFYKQKYAELNFANTGLLTSDDFLKIPPLTRDELRDNFENIKAFNVSKKYCHKATTSGSTGPPVSVYHDKRHPETPIRWRILNWWGVQPWENQAFIYRFKKSFYKDFKNKIMWWPTQRVFLAAANLTERKLNKFIRKFNKLQPALLQGYVDVVFEVALYILDNNIKIHSPKMVWVTSAPLFEDQRELIEKAFGAPVCDQYGNTEILLIAAECPEQNGLHIMQDTVHIEFVDENNQPVPADTTGKILLTDLTNYAFPIIRYEIGDEGKYLDYQCKCGRTLPLMENVRGRQSMVLKTPSGLTIRGEHIMAMFNGYMKAFKEIQLLQEADYTVRIDYVPRKKDLGKEQASKMVEQLKCRARSEIEIWSNETNTIKRINNKKPLIISHLV